MNITTYPYHLTERQLKLCHVRDPSTDTGESQTRPTRSARAVDPSLPFETYQLTKKSYLYSNHTETIIKYFVTNLNNHKTQNRSGHLVY